MNKQTEKNNQEKEISIEELSNLLEEVKQGELSSTRLKLIEKIIILVQNLYVALEKKKVNIKEIKEIFIVDP